MNEEQNFFWLVGLLEGEGSFLKPSPSRPNEPRIELEMNDEAVVRRAGSLTHVGTQRRVRKQHEPPRIVFRIRVSGRRAAAFMRRLRPWLSARRQAQVDAALDRYHPHSEKIALEAEGLFALTPTCTHSLCDHAVETWGDTCTAHRTVQLTAQLTVVDPTHPLETPNTLDRRLAA